METCEKNKDDMDRLDWLIRLMRVVRRLGDESIPEPLDTGRLVHDLDIVVSRIKAREF
jgi:hypothetical protein